MLLTRRVTAIVGDGVGHLEIIIPKLHHDHIVEKPVLLSVLICVSNSLGETLLCPEVWIAGTMATITDGSICNHSHFVLFPFVKALLSGTAAKHQGCDSKCQNVFHIISSLTTILL